MGSGAMRHWSSNAAFARALRGTRRSSALAQALLTNPSTRHCVSSATMTCHQSPEKHKWFIYLLISIFEMTWPRSKYWNAVLNKGNFGIKYRYLSLCGVDSVQEFIYFNFNPTFRKWFLLFYFWNGFESNFPFTIDWVKGDLCYTMNLCNA